MEHSAARIEATIDARGDIYRLVQRADFDSERAAGRLIPPTGAVEADGPRSFIQVSGKWYEQEKGTIAQLRDSPSSLLALLDETLVDVRESSMPAPAGLRRFDAGYEVAGVAEAAREEVGEDDPSTSISSTFELSRFGEDPRVGEPPTPVATVPSESGL